MIDYTIIVKDMSHEFSKKRVLNRVTFQVEQGEIFGLLGPSGAGKTTLIKILTGQLHQNSGYSQLLGTDTNCLGAKEYKQIGMMIDNFGLYERLSVYSNLAFYADIYHVSKSKISDILKSIGLYDSKNIAVLKLSKGMKNRLSLARAFMNDVKILFLDEPTSGLDPVTTREIHDILIEQKKKGITIFLTTHNMFEAESLCDHVALLNQGNIIEFGKPADICRKYNHLNRLQIMLKNGANVELENSSKAAISIKEYLEQDMIETIHSTEPTLESVFIELTGRGLNEYGKYDCYI